MEQIRAETTTARHKGAYSQEHQPDAATQSLRWRRSSPGRWMAGANGWQAVFVQVAASINYVPCSGRAELWQEAQESVSVSELCSDQELEARAQE